MATRGSFARAAACALVAICALATAGLDGQAPQMFQFIIGATDASGMPVTDLRPEEILMSENDMPAKVVKVEPYAVPVKLTVAVDNGVDSRDALAHYRTGLTGLVEALPAGVEVTLIATAPQPRNVVRASTDRTQILRGINGFAPQDERPRFTDALVEFSQRLERELKDQKAVRSLPIMVMISTTASEQTSYEVSEIEKALTFLAARKARLFVVMTSTRTGDVASVADINTNRQALIAIPAVKATRGRYEAIAVSSRLTSLLPEFGKQIAELHNAHANQVLVTVERPAGLSGPLQNPRIELARAGLSGAVSVDGLP